MKRARHYEAADIQDDFKTFIAALYKEQHKKGKKRKDFVNECSLAGLVFAESTLENWVANLNIRGSAISTEKASGSDPLLNREQKDVCSGWVLVSICKGKEVHLDDYCNFADEHFGIKLSPSTASNYLEEDGFTYRTVQNKNRGYDVDVAKLRNLHWNWVQKQHFPKERKHLCSFDFTFTGHRTERRRSWGIKGGAAPMVTLDTSRFTNCIVTCVWADGINRTPPILYTYNPAFRRDRKLTKKRKAQLAHLDVCLKRYNINPDRVVYIGKDKYEKDVYARESPQLVRLFFEHYGVDPDDVVLSDNGTSMVENGRSIFEVLGFKKHICYEAPVHQYGSPNDNNLHGASKQVWRTSKVGNKDDVASCVGLLYHLDKDIVEHSKYYFDRNMLQLTESGLEELIAWGSHKMSHLHRDWTRAYYIHMGQDARGPRDSIPKQVRDGLDGVYWL